ncbi:hypothetical protein BCEN4_450071 [Burkholderia cenocepacia]|nr:hypothetical protein BCEN4_450071 [Burkholderia cenocepacia]
MQLTPFADRRFNLTEMQTYIWKIAKPVVLRKIRHYELHWQLSIELFINLSALTDVPPLESNLSY